MTEDLLRKIVRDELETWDNNKAEISVIKDDLIDEIDHIKDHIVAIEEILKELEGVL